MSDITAEMMKPIIESYLKTKQPLQFKDYQDGWDLEFPIEGVRTFVTFIRVRGPVVEPDRRLYPFIAIFGGENDTRLDFLDLDTLSIGTLYPSIEAFLDKYFTGFNLYTTMQVVNQWMEETVLIQANTIKWRISGDKNGAYLVLPIKGLKTSGNAAFLRLDQPNRMNALQPYVEMKYIDNQKIKVSKIYRLPNLSTLQDTIGDILTPTFNQLLKIIDHKLELYVASQNIPVRRMLALPPSKRE